ncbi:MAG: sugar ABC transporter permease, partial [Tissierellales bacterium]|nr:sugar ABC transporter permease [Tissierellales bacterium]
MGFINELKKMLKENIRDYGMFIALFAIIIGFTILTDGMFISPRNISNLINSVGYIAVLAVGMTLIIVIRHIDLSVGYLAGFSGAIVAILLTRYNMSMFIAIPIVLVLGIVVGLFNGFLVGKVKVPAFVVSLAGMMIFRGALLQVTSQTGTIIVNNKAFNNIGNGFIPDFPFVNIPGLHVATLIIGVLAICL